MEDTRVWLKNYPPGVAANIDPDKHPNVLSALREAFTKYSSQVAFHCMGKDITYKELDKLSDKFGAYLLSRGLEKGDKIALMMPNMIQYPIALFGALKAELVIVNTNPLYTATEMEHQFKDAGVKAILICENFAHNLQKIIKNTAIKVVITTSIGECLGTIKGALVNFAVRKIKKMVPKFDIPNSVTFSDAIKNGKNFKLPENCSNSEDVILLQYTGGTTGVAKGAMLTNRNLLANLEQIKMWMSSKLKESEEVSLSPLPCYHIFAFTVNCLALFTNGIKNILIVNPRELDSIVKEFKKHPISVMTGVNTLFNALNNHAKFREVDTSSLKVTIGGGMAVQPHVAREWQKNTGCYLAEGYGMTESSPVACVNPLDSSAKLGTIGIPVPSTELRIVDDSGNVLGVGEAGEIQIKGPQVMKGYYNRPQETDKVFVGDWLLTGDIGMMDENGFFKIVDRKKDMILVSGFNVYPNEIEDLACCHEKVLEAAAIGIADEKSTEKVKLFVVKKDESLTKEELFAHCKEHLTGYKRPKEIEFRKELPKSNVGKILRRKLK